MFKKGSEQKGNCTHCSGTGIRPCSCCGKVGYNISALVVPTFSPTCPFCNGARETPCPFCHGTGKKILKR